MFEYKDNLLLILQLYSMLIGHLNPCNENAGGGGTDSFFASNKKVIFLSFLKLVFQKAMLCWLGSNLIECTFIGTMFTEAEVQLQKLDI